MPPCATALAYDVAVHDAMVVTAPAGVAVIAKPAPVTSASTHMVPIDFCIAVLHCMEPPPSPDRDARHGGPVARQLLARSAADDGRTRGRPSNRAVYSRQSTAPAKSTPAVSRSPGTATRTVANPRFPVKSSTAWQQGVKAFQRARRDSNPQPSDP